MNKKIKVALAGNPNCGKTTLFNKLTKSRYKTGNYPGVTVEKKEGSFSFQNHEIVFVDLPGIYNLSFQSEDEKIAQEYLLKEPPDIIINIIDASNIERSLYLTTQLMELQVPIILVFNKIDLAQAHGININYEKASMLLEAKIALTIGSQGKGIDEIFKQIISVFKKKQESLGSYLRFSEDVEESLSEIENVLEENISKARWTAIKLLEEYSSLAKENFSKQVLETTQNKRELLSEKYQESIEQIIAQKRYEALAKIVKEITLKSFKHKQGFTDKIDKIVTNKFLGIPLFFILIYLVFYFTFTLGAYPSIWLAKLFQNLASFISKIWQTESLLYSLVVDGIISGVGSVLIFVPNILLLFIAISFLEESGYMARVALIMDRMMHKIGLHGKSFLPFLIGFGCTVPAVMSTRILENKRDRLTTMLVLPLIPCSAKLAVFTLLIPSFFPLSYRPQILFLLYFIGIFLAILIIFFLRKTIFKGENIPFVIELPLYQIPSFKNILNNTWQKARVYVKKAGTFILFVSIILWFLSVFPLNDSFSKEYQRKSDKIKKETLVQLKEMPHQNISGLYNCLEKKDALNFFKEITSASFVNSDPLLYDKILKLQNKFNEAFYTLKKEKKQKQLYHSYISKMGRFLQPVFEPLGFDWKINTALFGAILAKEVFISQLGIIFAIGEEGVSALQTKLNQNYSVLQGFCILLFLLISMPCIATFAMTKHETNYKWAVLQFSSLTLIAYFITMAVYQISKIWF